jgi:hypothetical protein
MLPSSWYDALAISTPRTDRAGPLYGVNSGVTEPGVGERLGRDWKSGAGKPKKRCRIVKIAAAPRHALNIIFQICVSGTVL